MFQTEASSSTVSENNQHEFESTFVMRVPSDPLFENADCATLLSLPYDRLYLLFANYCTLKDQITLTKVCQYFCDIIINIWRLRYKTRTYNLNEFELTLGLTMDDINHFFTICGKYIYKLTFNSLLCYPLIERHFLRKLPGNLMHNAKIFINVNLCRNLVYFENLHTLEVQGQLLCDLTIRSLAQYCKNLHAINLLDCGSRNLKGKYCHSLLQLEKLHIPDCQEFHKRFFTKCCQVLKLKSLNIMECKRLNYPHYLKRICINWQHLTTLRMTAIADMEMLKAIVSLPNLKLLSFYWYNAASNFELLLFTHALTQKSTQLKCIKFAQDRMLMCNNSEIILSAYEHALEREYNTINAMPWLWNSAYFEKFYQFQSLEQIICEYCRLFAIDDLINLKKQCPNLKFIDFIGCRRKEDETMLRDFRSFCTENLELPDIQLHVEGLVPLEVVELQREKCQQLNFRTRYTTVLRNIECCFT